MKREIIALKNAVEMDSVQAYFRFSCKVHKIFYIWFVKPICFATPKLHIGTTNGVATHSLRSPALGPQQQLFA